MAIVDQWRAVLGRRSRGALAVMLAGAIGIAGCGSDDEGAAGGGGGAPTGPITVGFLAPLSGPAASVGKDTQEGAQLAIDKANAAGGINGQQVKLDVQDSQFDPNIGSQVATRFARNTELPLMIGSL